MKSIGPLLGHDIHGSANHSADLSKVTVGLQLEFLNAIDNWSVIVVSKKRQVVDTIHQKHVASVSLPVHGGESEGTQRTPSPAAPSAGILGHADGADPRYERQELREIPAI